MQNITKTLGFNRCLQMILLGSCVAITGCQGLKPTSFSPFDARLEPVPGGGTKYLVLVNVSNQDLHNWSFSAYLWNERQSNPIVAGNPHCYAQGSGRLWKAGTGVRIRQQGTGVELPINKAVTKVQLVGHCDEGAFRQVWAGAESDVLRRLGATSELARQ
jgi:hypothetical protein